MSANGLEIPQADIDARATSNGRHPGDHKGTLLTAQSYGFLRAEACYLRGDPQANLKELVEIVRREPVLVTGKFHHFESEEHNSGHAIVVIGISGDGKYLIYHDPHHRKAANGVGRDVVMPAAEFLERWSLWHHGWVLWLGT